ncbi:MAG: hypothetical protein ABJB01_00225 [Rudaea sp.]
MSTHASPRNVAAVIAATLGSLTMLAPTQALSFTVDNTPRSASATTVFVTTCADSTQPGTLRNAISTATTGQVIDLGHLTCSTITMDQTLGQMIANVDSLTVTSSGAMKTIDGVNKSRLISLTGSGKLTLTNLFLTRGSVKSPTGGCVYSHGSVELVGSRITNCFLYGTNEPIAQGGAIFARNDVALRSSSISQSSVFSLNVAAGGAIAAGGSVLLTVDYTVPGRGGSAITATSTYGNPNSTGGAISAQGVTMRRSTIERCVSSVAGAIDADSVGIYSSTISRNVSNGAVSIVGGVLAQTSANVSNSTFAYNQGAKYGALRVGSQADVIISSSIFAQSSTSTGVPIPDISQVPSTNPPPKGIRGGSNLVQRTSVALPSDTIAADPQFGATTFCSSIAGSALTTVHTLLPGSPALLRGFPNSTTDTDECGNSLGAAGDRVDIGALQQSSIDDQIFKNDFENHP